jgi:3-dehydroquinate synthase
MSVEQFIDLMAVDKKNIDGNIRLILLESIGKAALPINIERQKLEQTLLNYAG